MFKPVNRYIQVEMEAAEGAGPSGIVLPEDYAPAKEKYATASVVSWAADVRFDDSLIINAKIVIDQSMIEEIQINNEKITVILDNYVVGII
jgi:co-chaperonin GroES (HSP10)|tara:strand:- start:9012 stop:9284 length:273 start_codon:yes stop_codon:yes gene_type:complete